MSTNLLSVFIRITSFWAAILGIVWVGPIILGYLGFRSKFYSTASLVQKALLFIAGFVMVGVWTIFVLWVTHKLNP